MRVGKVPEKEDENTGANGDAENSGNNEGAEKA